MRKMNDRNYQLLNDLNQYDKALDDIYHNYAMRHGLSDTALWILYFVVSSGQDCTQTDISEQWSYRRQPSKAWNLTAFFLWSPCRTTPKANGSI